MSIDGFGFIHISELFVPKLFVSEFIYNAVFVGSLVNLLHVWQHMHLFRENR